MERLRPSPLDDDEAEHATVAAATTIEDAKRKALEQLSKIVPVVNEADVEFIVLDEGSKGGFFGRGKAEARVEAGCASPGTRSRARAGRGTRGRRIRRRPG